MATADIPQTYTRGHMVYTLAATGRAGDRLYEWRNWRVGGREYLIVNPDGSTRDGTRVGRLGRATPKPPTTGRWRWLREG